MTSTNDGKEVKSYQTSGPKGKSHYIELYKSLEARLSEVSEATVRTQHLCEAWYQVHTLCLHSSLTTHPHLLSWLQRHTARTILQTKWQSPERKDDRASLETAINGFIVQCQQASSERENFQWETQLIARGEWFKRYLDRPWDHPVLGVLLNPSGTPPTDDEVLSWLIPERGVTFVMRLLTLVAEKCEDIAASLTAAVMDRVRARVVLIPDQLQTDDKDKSNLSPALSDFGEKLSSEAGFTTEVWELLTDIEFVLLYKRDRARCIALAKQTPLKNAYQLVERLQSRLELTPREKKLWKNAKDVAVLISEVVITRCMVIPVCGGIGRNALYCCSRSLARALGPKLPSAAAQLGAPAASARHLHTLATAVDAHFTQINDQKMKPFVCELYVRAITAGMNELERLKIKTEKESEARQMEQTLASWFVQLGAVLSSSDRIRCECTLTAFSLHPSLIMYERIKAAPALAKSAVELESPSKELPTSEFGSWASDSRSQTNFVKTSETLNMKNTQNQANVLSTAILNEGEAIGLSPDVCHDMAVLLSGPRVKTLSWDMDREQLIEKCRIYMERTHGGTRVLTTELKYLNLDPNEFMHLPEEDDDENDLYYGIEKGYEHLVQFQDPEDIWKDPERTESAHSTHSNSDTDIVTSRRKKTGKKVALSSDDDADPLSKIAETQRNENKERPHSKERSKKERKKKELKDPLEINPPKEKKENLPKKEKEKKERKKKVKSSRESLAKLIGIKVIKQPSRPTKAANATVPTSFVTDSDYDSQGKSSFTSVNSEPTDILYDGLFPMDELKSPERGSKEFNVSNDQVGLNYPTNRFQNNQPVLDSYRRPINYLSHSSTVVSDEVKKNLSKLIDSRRQVSTPRNQSPIPSNIDLDNSITAFRSNNISTQTPQKKVQNAITRPKTPLQTYISPKAVAIPEIPKSIINKDSPRIVQIKKDVEDCLQRFQRNLNDTSIPSPVIQYAKKNDDTTLQPTNPFKMSDLVTVPQERFGPYDTKPAFTQSRPGGSVHRPPIRESAGELNYQKFLEEFQRSVDEKYNKSLKKEIKPVSRVPPVIPNVIKAETKTPKRAKPKPQQKKPDNSLNTFSRLSYMHKNKQMDIKNKLTERPDHGNVSRVSFETKIGDFVLEHLRKSSQNLSCSVDPPKTLNECQNARKPETSEDPNYPMLSNMLGHSQIGNANINTSPIKPILKLNAPSPNSYLSEKDQNDLIILLRQQNKFNAPAPFSRPMNLKAYPTCPSPSPRNVSDHNIVKNHFAPSTSAASITNTFKKSVNENKQINVISTSIIKPPNSAPGAQSTIRPVNVTKKDIKDDVQEKSKKPESFKPRILAKAEIKKSEDWQAVMNAIRAQKTPSRGPNALDIALNKSSFEKAFEDSLRRNECSEQDSKVDANTVKTDKPQLIKHSTVSADFATQDNSKSKTYNRPKASNKSAESTKNVSANKYMNTKNLIQKKANNIDLSQKTSVEQPKKKLPHTGHKGDDPFISGIPNSDYDLIEELMDDDLRKEIGELSSDEDYSTAVANILKPTKPPEKRVSVIYNKTLATTPALQKSVVANQTNIVQPQKCIYENKAVVPPKPVHRQYNAISTPSVTAPSCSSETHVFSNINTYVHNSKAVNSNVYISAVPQPPVQNVNLIASNVVYEGYTNVQRSVAVTNMTHNAYVAVNNVPNMTLYQSTQYAVPVINPVIIESAITMPGVSNMPCPIPVQTNAVNNLKHSEYSTNKEIPSVQGYAQPTVASCEVSKIESRPNYNFNDHPLMNDHVKTDVNMLETYLNKNSERKVLSEVQEKQVFSLVQEKQVIPEFGEQKEKSKKIDYNKIIDQERLRKKRIAIMNRKIWHYSERKPIALGYSPIFPVVQNTLSEPNYNCKSDSNIEDLKTEVGLEVASPASQDSMDNCKENKDNELTCRRILLRSSNTLKVKVPNDTSTKIADKNTTAEAPNIAKESDTGVAKVIEGRPKRKRVLKRLRDKPVIKEKTEKQKPRRLKLNVGKKVPLKIKSNKVIDKKENPVDNIDCSMNFIDIEAELVGSKIPKICKVEKTRKYRSVSNESAQDDEKLLESVSQNGDNMENTHAKIDRDIKVTTRRSSRLAGNANTQLTKDIKEAKKLASMLTEVEVYVPILSDNEKSIEDSANLSNINIEEDVTSIVTAPVLERLPEVNQNQTEPVIHNFATDNITYLDKMESEVSKEGEGKDENIPNFPLQEVTELVTKLAESPINNEAEKIFINDGFEQEVTEIKTCHYSVVTSNDKSVNVDNNDITETIEQSDNNLPTAANEDKVEKEKHTTSNDFGFTSNDRSVGVDNIDMTETIEESGNILSNTAKEVEIEKDQHKTCNDSVVSSNDKSVNVNNSNMNEITEESGNKLPAAAKEDEVEKEKVKTCHDSVVTSNKSVKVDKSNMIETIEISSNVFPTAAREDEFGKENDTTLAYQHDVVQLDDTAVLRSENNVNLSEIPQSFKDSIIIDHIPNQEFDDPLKQCVRIKLPNGRVFKATVFGQLNVDFDSLFEEPAIKSVLLNSLTSKKKNFTLNVKQTTINSKHDLKVISTRKTQGQIIDTVDLLSDDEEISQEFTTEYGKYKIQPIDTEVHKMHQYKFKQKSAILLKRCDRKKDNSIQTNAIGFTCKEVLSNDDKLESPTVSSTKSIENVIESVKATWEKLKESVSANPKSNEKIINLVYSTGNVDNKKTEEGEVVLIDDSSSEDELPNICDKDPKVINVLANKLLIDLGVCVASVPKIDEPIKSNCISTMPIEIPEIDLTEESSIMEPASKSIQGENIKKCYVKLVRCDHLVNLFLKTRKKDSTKNITDVNAGKTTSIVKKNTVNVANTETNLDANKDPTITIITDLDEASPKPRSRSNSFSILDDYPILNDIDMRSTEHDRSSPVIEAFDLIASYEHFLKPKLKSPQIMPLKCDSDWFATKIIQSCHSDTCKTLQDVSPAISLCCDSEWFTTKDIISKQIMIKSSNLGPITVLSNADIEKTSKIEVPALTSLTLAYLQNIELLDNLQPITNAYNLIPATLKRKLVPSNDMSTPKITKLNIMNKTNAQNNSSTDSDLTDMSGVTVCDENSTTICKDTPVLLESAECITATNDILSESVKMEFLDNKPDVDLSIGVTICDENSTTICKDTPVLLESAECITATDDIVSESVNMEFFDNKTDVDLSMGVTIRDENSTTICNDPPVLLESAECITATSESVNMAFFENKTDVDLSMGVTICDENSTTICKDTPVLLESAECITATNDILGESVKIEFLDNKTDVDLSIGVTICDENSTTICKDTPVLLESAECITATDDIVSESVNMEFFDNKTDVDLSMGVTICDENSTTICKDTPVLLESAECITATNDILGESVKMEFLDNKTDVDLSIGVTICDENSTTICKDTPVLLESAECITATDDIVSESVNMEFFDNKTDVDLSMGVIICDENSTTICNDPPVLLESAECITATDDILSESVNIAFFDNKTDVDLSMGVTICDENSTTICKDTPVLLESAECITATNDILGESVKMEFLDNKTDVDLSIGVTICDENSTTICKDTPVLLESAECITATDDIVSESVNMEFFDNKTDVDLSMGVTIRDENSTTICNDTPVLLESAECITATDDIISESVNMELFDNKTDVDLFVVANQVLEEQVILNHSESVETINATKPINAVCEGASNPNILFCGNMQIDCNAEKSDTIDVENDILRKVEDSDLSALSCDLENIDGTGTITNPTCRETTQYDNVENKDNIIIEQPDIVKKYEASNKFTQEDSNNTDISGDSGNILDSNINNQLDTAETCKSKSAQTLENINASDILDDSENSITFIVNDLTTKPESVPCENMDTKTPVQDVVEMYAPKIAHNDIFVADVSNDSVNKNEVKEITDVICEEIIKSSCLTRVNIDNSEAKECKIIERGKSDTVLESKLGKGINIPAIADNTNKEEHSFDIDITIFDNTYGYKTDLLLSEELNKGSKTIEEPVVAFDTESGTEETISIEEKTIENLLNVKFIHAGVEENSDVLEEKPILNNNDNIGTSSVSCYLKDDTNKANECDDQANTIPASGDNALNWEMSIVNAEENIVGSLPALPNNTTLLTKYLKLTGEKGSEIILKGIEYVDAEAGSCYMFPLVEQSTSPEVSLETADRDEIMNLIREATDGGTNDKIEDILDCDTDLKVTLPKNTYSKVVEDARVTRNLKRKRDMSDVRLQEKKYRKGKNIDYPKITVAAMNANVYVKEYKRLIDYYSTLKFSYSRPFHKENIDVDDMIKDWPVRDVQTNTKAESVDAEATIFTEEDKAISPKDPLQQTLAQELISDYDETEYKPTDITETNFSMGFGEGSGRVIQHSKTGKILKLSAATLSDVKPHQPYLSSESNKIKIDNTHKENNNEKTKLIQNMNFIQIKEKVRSFFKKTATELTYDFMKEHKKCSVEDTLNFPFGLTSTDFFDQLPHEVVVNIVQVGQLPVSAAAQNPVTCDPRVTHVSNVSPSQCSAENSPGDDNQTSRKTEYTELTTADITLPLVQEYAQHHHQFTSNDTQESSKTQESDQNICEVNTEIKIELTEETTQEKIEENGSYESEPLPVQSGNPVNNEVPFSYNEVPNNLSVESNSNQPTMPDETKMPNTFSESKDEENVNKPDQLAHAMNAAGITTTSNIIHTTNADALVDIISQNAQSDVVTTTQINTNNYSKSTPINAVALQQALAQILPPPLTSASESGQTATNAVAPPVLHIVQGSNTQTVLNTQNGTPLLHIVQNKTATTSNGTPTSQANSFSGLSLVDTGLQQGGNQLLHIVNTGNQKNNNAGQLLKRVNLLTNITNVQGSNEQKMVQFVCKSADGKSIQLNAPHQRSMVLRLQAIDPSTIQQTPKPTESQDVSAHSGNPLNNKDLSQQDLKSRSVYEENYAKFIQNGTGKPGQENSTSLPKFNQVFGKQVSYQENKNEINNDGLSENTDGKQNENLQIDQINEINNPPLLLRKSTDQTSQAPTNLVQQIKQTLAPMNIQTMHGGVIYTRQIPVNIGGGQTINLITVPSTELVDDAMQKQQTDNKFTNQDGDHVIKIVQNQSNTSNSQNEDNNNAQMNSNDTSQAPQPQPVLTQMRIKLPMLSKTPQMVAGARVVRPSFFQIQRNVIGGANQPVYQQLVLTTAPPLGQSIRVPAHSARSSKLLASQSSPESQMSSSTLEQLREFDMVLEQVKERSTVQPSSTNSNSFSSIRSSADTTDSSAVVSTSVTETTQQVLYTTGNQTLNIASYVNRKSTVTSASTSFVRSPDSSGIVESPSSSTHSNIPHTATSESTSSETPTPKPKKKKSRPSSSSTSGMKLNTTPPKTSTQKPLEDEQTTQRILYILAEYKEQVENSPDKDKPAPRRRNNLPPNIPGSSKRKKSGSRRRDMSPILGEDSCRTMGSEDSSCGTSLGECAECMESHSPQESPRKVVRRLTFEQETTTTTQVTTQTRTIPQRNVIVADGQTITVARGPAGKPATTVLMPANYLLPVSMVKGGQQIAIMTNRGPKLLVGGGEGGTGGTLLFQRLIGPAGLKPVLTRPGVRHIRLPTAALHNLQAFNLTSAAAPVDSTASPASASVPGPPDLVDSRAMSSPWSDRGTGEAKPDRGSSPDGSEPWNLPSSSIAEDYGYEEIVRTDNMDRTVLDAIPDRYSPDMEAQRIFDKMFDVDSKKSMYDTSRCGYDIDASDTDDRPYQVVQRKDGRHRFVASTALKHKYAILEHELRLQKSLSEECEDLGVDSPSASELFPEAELLFAPSPVHEQTIGPCHTPQPTILNQGIPQPDLEDQIATDHLLTHDHHSDLDINLDDVGEIVTVGEDGMAMIPLDHEEFARSHPNTTFHTEPEDGEVVDGEIPPFTIAQSIKGRQITFHASRGPNTVVMAPQTTVISQATVEASGTHNTVKFTDIDNMINSIPNTQHQMPSVLVKDDGLTRFDSILTDSRELHLSNTASAIVHSTGQGTQVIRRVRYDENRRESRYFIDEPDPMEKIDDNRDLESMAGDDNSSSERHPELFWESNSASERSEGRRRMDFSSDSDKCCKSPFDDSTDSSFGNHMRLDSVIKAARTERSGSDGSSDDHRPLRTYPAKRTHHHPTHHDAEQSLSGKTRAGERCMDVESRRRASNRGVVKRGCHCCNGSPTPPKPKKSRPKKTPADFTNTNNN